jgi:hypothetical protein
VRRCAAALALLALGGCGGGDEDGGTLVWVGEPKITTPARLPDDRVLSGMVKNDSLRPVEVVAKEVRLIDAAGRRVSGNVVFLQAFVRGIYPPARAPAELPEAEARRTGLKATVEPGKTIPVTAAWRQRPGSPPPVRVDYGAGSLPIP